MRCITIKRERTKFVGILIEYWCIFYFNREKLMAIISTE